MRCPNCGQRLSENVSRCPSCGLIFTEEERMLMREEQTAQETRPEEEVYTAEESEQYQEPAAATWPVRRGLFDDGLPDAEPYHGRMKWYLFVINIQLILSAISFGFNGFLYLGGSLYGDQTGTLYGAYPGLGLLDKGYGIFALIMAVLTVFVRNKMKRYQKGAPGLLIMLYGLSLIGTIVYLGIEMVIVKQNLVTSDLIISIAVSLFMICVNIYYFRKRNYLFCN